MSTEPPPPQENCTVILTLAIGQKLARQRPPLRYPKRTRPPDASSAQQILFLLPGSEKRKKIKDRVSLARPKESCACELKGTEKTENRRRDPAAAAVENYDRQEPSISAELASSAEPRKNSSARFSYIVDKLFPGPIVRG